MTRQERVSKKYTKVSRRKRTSRRSKSRRNSRRNSKRSISKSSRQRRQRKSFSGGAPYSEFVRFEDRLHKAKRLGQRYIGKEDTSLPPLSKDQVDILRNRPLSAQIEYKRQLPDAELSSFNLDRRQNNRFFDQIVEIQNKKDAGQPLTLMEQVMLHNMENNDTKSNLHVPTFKSAEDLRSNVMNRRRAVLNGEDYKPDLFSQSETEAKSKSKPERTSFWSMFDITPRSSTTVPKDDKILWTNSEIYKPETQWKTNALV